MTSENGLAATSVQSIVHMPKCWTCEGTGRKLLRTCHRCKGTGVFEMREKSTAGPWSLMCDEARGRPRCLIVDKDGGEIAAVNPHRTAWHENAELMAAAPVMFEALRQIDAWHDMEHEKMTYGEVQDAYDKTINAVKAALHKVM